MRRREFISLLVGAAAARPVATHAQPHFPIIGFLHVGSASALSHLVVGFRQGLKEAGYVEGQNVSIEFRWAEGQYDRLPAFAADLVRRRVSVIVTGGGDAPAAAAKAATTTIPIVFNVGIDPSKTGLVVSLSRPGGNATGVNIFTAELAAKRLGLLNELVPTASLIALLINPNFPPSAASAREVQAAATQIDRRILLLKGTNDREIDDAFTTMVRQKVGALIVGADPYFNSRRKQFVELASRHAIPAVYEQREFVTAGGLMSYGTDITASYRQMGVYAGQILSGFKPNDLPVMQLSKFELVINAQTAKALRLEIPAKMLALADEVIE